MTDEQAAWTLICVRRFGRPPSEVDVSMEEAGRIAWADSYLFQVEAALAGAKVG